MSNWPALTALAFRPAGGKLVENMYPVAVFWRDGLEKYSLPMPRVTQLTAWLDSENAVFQRSRSGGHQE